METIAQISHIKLPLKGTYEAFKTNFETLLNRLEYNWSDKLATDLDGVKKHLKEVAGDTGLMIFDDQEHGLLLAYYNRHANAIQYSVGNPLVALEMTKHDIRTGLYAPIRVLIYEDQEAQLFAEYDLPSSQFGQFDEAVLPTAHGLDKKLKEVILNAAGQDA
jgi:uncharacterized protein (DUF302 family)